MTESVPLYDTFSARYDYFVNWEQRLRHEMPFIERQLGILGARRVLDVACGTGRHSVALAQAGYDVTGTDLSAGMIEQARKNAALADRQARFVVAGFSQLRESVDGEFDALLCLGNSLPHVLTRDALRATVADFTAVLRRGGLVLMQSRNFDAVMANGNRWIGPQSYADDNQEWLFVRFYDFRPDGTLTFNVLSLQRESGGAWSQEAEATTLRPWLHEEVLQAIADAGFAGCVCYGNMGGAPFDAASSDDLVLLAHRE
jgi:glycine/sarcosine N-methyltransferase